MTVGWCKQIKLMPKSSWERVQSNCIASQVAIESQVFLEYLNLSSICLKLEFIFFPVSDDVEAKINKIFDDINDDMVPVVEKVLHHQLKDVSDKMFGNFSYDQLFPL